MTCSINIKTEKDIDDARRDKEKVNSEKNLGIYGHLIYD